MSESPPPVIPNLEEVEESYEIVIITPAGESRAWISAAEIHEVRAGSKAAIARLEALSTFISRLIYGEVQ